MKINILVFNWKGGAAKTTISSIVASYLNNATLIELDKINKSDKRIYSEKFYQSMQLDFVNETSDSFFKFENLLLDDGVKVVDVGAVKLETFHSSMKSSDLYGEIDLIVIPAMDGADDFNVAIKFLLNIKGLIDTKKIIIAFNRFDPIENDNNPAEQFETFFNNKEVLKKEFDIDLEDDSNFFVIKNSKAIKKARGRGITLKSLIDTDINEITKRQRAEKDSKKRLELTKQRGLIINAQNLYRDYIEPMMLKISKKLEA